MESDHRAPYKPQIKTTDLLDPARVRIGQGRHVYLLDLILAIRSEDDETIITLMYGGRTQEECAEILGLHQTSVSRRLKSLLKRAS